MADEEKKAELIGRLLAIAAVIAEQEGLSLEERGGPRAVAGLIGIDESTLSKWRKAMRGDAPVPNVRSDNLEAFKQAAKKYRIDFDEGTALPADRLVEPRTERDDGGDRAQAVLAVLETLDVPREHLPKLRELVQGLAASQGLEQLTTMLRLLYVGWLQGESGRVPVAHQGAQQVASASAVQHTAQVTKSVGEGKKRAQWGKPAKGR